MFEALANALSAGLTLWKNKDARKYLDKVIKLKKEWYEVYNSEPRDLAVLDGIEFELRIVSEAFSSRVGNEKS